ncbi:MAG: alpha/beta fold hydrolase, partial [Geodermatophilaceae bacterium]|nr:alpha/beta fold hydrolase [Geodermatophilaceae bacterium]
MRARRAGPAIAIALVLVTGCVSTVNGIPAARDVAPVAGTQSAPAPPPAAELVLSDCTDTVDELLSGGPPPDRELTWECGSLDVPLDYADPDRDTVQLAVVRGRLDAERDRIGSLVINPGGPGGSGTDAALNLAYRLPIEVVEGFDVIGFDPRGVNFSDPITCVSDEYKDELYGAEPYARDEAEFQVQVEIAETLADGCFERYGEDLGQFNTVNTAHDMDQLRAALDEEQLTYLGYSYGTTLGSTYAELFPDRVRALVLDGATDPTLDDRGGTEAQARGFEAAFGAFAAACAAQEDCEAGDDPAATVQQVLDDARTEPLPADDDRKVPVGLVWIGVISALYDERQWPTLAAAIGSAADGDGSGLAALADGYTGRAADGEYPNRLEANLSINCADTAERYDDDEIREFIEDLRRKYPLFGAPIATNLLTCDRWRTTRTPLPERDAAGAPPILVIGTVNDPATPYSGAQAMAGELDSAVLLTWQGEGHTAYPKTPCITQAVDAYLL